MKLVINQIFKSLEPFESEELANLTVITGKNGSGKSQLLQMIAAKHKGEEIGRYIEFTPSIRRIQAEGLTKSGPSQVSYDNWSSIINAYYNQYVSLSRAAKKLLTYVAKHEIDISKGIEDRFNADLTFQALCNSAFEEIQRRNGRHTLPRMPDPMLVTHKLNTIQELFDPVRLKTAKLVCEICIQKAKSEVDLNLADFATARVSEYYIDNSDLFASQVELIFYNYVKRSHQNRIDYFHKREEGEANDSVSPQEFLQVNPSPWQVINSVFDRHGVDFRFEEVSERNFAPGIAIQIRLIKKSLNKQILYDDLSSGEKVIIGLILKLFTSEYYKDKLSFPELLILDEPDAHLHPEMSKLLLDVLVETFVKKYGIKVILTTHSPSTIAICPEDSIYQLTNGSSSALKKVTKDEALKLLTGFIPTLSIGYKNHRQVFVESPTDFLYYQSIHDKLQQDESVDFKLYFISNGYGKSNCDHVYKIVEQIRSSGNTTSYGIVDWDLNNQSKDFVTVHGAGERYSIENFQLDPIYLICLLMDLKAHDIYGKLGLSLTYNQYGIGNESNARLQDVTKYFFTQFEAKYPTYKYDLEKRASRYHNGKEIQVPQWYLMERGHNLVPKVKELFPALSQKYRGEWDLQNALSVIAAKCYPFVPEETIKTIHWIGKHP